MPLCEETLCILAGVEGLSVLAAYIHMGYSANKLTVLEDGAAAHALNNAAGLVQEPGVGDGEHDMTAVPVAVNTGDLHLIFRRLPPADGGNNAGLSGTDVSGLHGAAAQSHKGAAENAVGDSRGDSSEKCFFRKPGILNFFPLFCFPDFLLFSRKNRA